MNITKELRKHAGEMAPHWEMGTLLAIADRIDAEHERKVGCTADEWDYWESTHVELPKDADGEPVHIGDVMEWPTTGETFEVVGIGDGTLFYIEDGSELADWTGASTKRHHHAPTVEDVLREFAAKLCIRDGFTEATEETFAEYAAKLRLRGEDV